MGEENLKCDVLVIGAGPAGLAAATYSAWLGLRTIILESGIAGGRAWLAPKIENYPGFPEGISGNELTMRMSQHAARFNAEFRGDEEVVALDLGSDLKKVVSRKHIYETSALIIATGTQRRKLYVSGESDFLGRGVSYCSTCDGPFFKNKSVAIIGNGEEAAIDALFLVDISSKVTIVSQEDELDVTGTLLDRLKNKPNIEVLMAKVVEIIGDKIVKAIKILEYETHLELVREVDGVFISLGGVPMTAIVKNAGLATDRNGCLTVDRFQKTNIEGVFAAGDCTCGGMQIVTAAGEGAMAAMKASGYLRRKSKSP